MKKELMISFYFMYFPWEDLSEDGEGRMKYGYVRVSTREQNEDRQLIALHEMGVECASSLRTINVYGSAPVFLVGVFMSSSLTGMILDEGVA